MKERILKKEICYCPLCDHEHEVILKEKEAKATIKGRTISYIEKVYYCPNSDIEECEFATAKMMDENLLSARNAYRKMTGLLTSNDIKHIREKYTLTQLEFAKLLDYGDVTITRYETKQIQDKSHDEQMKRFDLDPSYPLECLFKHEKDFDRARFNKLRERFVDIASTEGEERKSRELLDLIYAKYNTLSLLNGNTLLDITKLEAIISYFAKQLNDLYKVKLMKLLWYADMLYFQKYQKSITGLVYTHEPLGALPIGHYSIMTLKNVLCEDVLDNRGYVCTCIHPNKKIHYSFSKEEQDTFDIVLDKFRSFTGKEISEYMHQEDAYIFTKEKEIISYKWAYQIKNFN